MRMASTLLWLMAGLFAFASAGDGALVSAGERYRDIVFPDVVVARDIPFGASTTFDGRVEMQHLDIYEPGDDTERYRAAIVHVHGGGFVSGDKADERVADFCTLLARRGYVVASINYRLRPGKVRRGMYDQVLDDARHDALGAVRWMRANAAGWGVDPDLIAIEGHSAGGMTAGMVAFDSEGRLPENDCCPDASGQVAAACIISGSWIDTSMVRPGAPPVLLIHGRRDETVPFRYAQLLEMRCRTLGIPIETYWLGGDHLLWAHAGDIAARAAAFFHRRVVRAPCGRPATGDLDGDQVLNRSDVARFAEALCHASQPRRMICAGDFDGDGAISEADILPFVAAVLRG